jgi:hypothetical protein
MKLNNLRAYKKHMNINHKKTPYSVESTMAHLGSTYWCVSASLYYLNAVGADEGEIGESGALPYLNCITTKISNCKQKY